MKTVMRTVLVWLALISITASVEAASVGSMLPGWPVQTGGSVRSAPVLADIDGDGVAEVVNLSDKISVVKGDGSSLPGWPQDLPSDMRYCTQQLAVGDLDGNGKQVIVAAANQHIYAWNADGTFKNGFPITVPVVDGRDPGFVSATLADIDGDGYLEIVATSYPQGKVFVWRHDGTLEPGWPIAIGTADAWLPTSPAVGDIDGDGYPEILVPYLNQVFALHHDGTPAAGWPISVDGTPSNVSLADIDHDGKEKVFVGVGEHVIYAFNGNGSPMPGWPQLGDMPAIGDINGDGELEIVSNFMGDMYAYRSDGRMLPGWPQPHLSYLTSSPSLGDIDGDGGVEIVARTVAGIIYAWHADGTPVPEFPIMAGAGTDGWYDVSVALGDINGDGQLDLITGSGSMDTKIYAYQMPGAYVPRLLPWPMSLHDAQRTAALVQTPVILTSSLTGVRGVLFNQKLVARGGYPPYAWGVTGGNLPPGLSLNGSTGEVYGTPTELGSFAFTVQVADANAVTVSRLVTLEDKTLAITTASLVPGAVWARYAQNLAVAGGAAPYTWTVLDGALPGGLTLDPGTGAITGFPSATGTFGVSIQVVDRNGSHDARTYAIVVSEWVDKKEGFGNGAGAAVDQAGNLYVTGFDPLGNFAAKYDASGNLIWRRDVAWDRTTDIAADRWGNVFVAGYIWGAAPKALLAKYDSTGTLLWTSQYDNGMTGRLAVDAAGNAYVAGRPPRSAGNDSFFLKYTAAGALQWEKTNLPGEPGGVAVDSAGNIYANFQQKTIKYDPSGNELWRRSYFSGTGGMAVDENFNVLIAGYDTVVKYDAAGNYLWSSTLPGLNARGLALDAAGNAYIAGFLFDGAAYDLIIWKLDVDGSEVWSKKGGATSTGSADAVAVDKTSGAVYVVGSVVNDFPGNLVILRFVQPVITSAALPEGMVGAPYSSVLTAQKGATPYTWSLASGVLPLGLTLESATGVIAGTPRVGGTYPLKVRATSPDGISEIRAITLTVSTTSLADFTASILTGYAPLSVTFTDSSGHSPFAWSWLFGDGSSGSGQSVTHIYTTPGTYSVMLTAANVNGDELVLKQSYITVLACVGPQALIRRSNNWWYGDMSNAYSYAVDDDIIQLLRGDLGGSIELNRNIKVSLQGGYNCDYSDNRTTTELTGNLRITDGTVNVDKLRLK